MLHRQEAFGVAVVAIWLGVGCGPGGVAASGTEHGTSETSETSETGETGEPDFPDLPDPEPGCLERGGMHALLSPPQLIISDHPDYIAPSDLQATSAGLLALFRMSPLEDIGGFPKAWVARLDEHGTPFAEPFMLIERGVGHGPRAHAAGDDVMLAFSGLWGGETRASSVEIDALGVPSSAELLLQPDDRVCCISEHSPEGAWTGHRHLFAWRDNSSGPLPGYELLLEARTSDGSSREWVQLQDDGEFHPEPRFVVTSEAAFMISAAGDDGAMLHRFDALGNVLADQSVTLEIPEDFRVGDAAMAANAEGFVIWLDESDQLHRVLRWHFDPEGQLLAGPIQVLPPALDSYDSDFQLVARPGGFALAAERKRAGAGWIVVMMLDPTGAPEGLLEIEPEIDGGLRLPIVAQRGDSTFVLYTADNPDDISADDVTHDLFVAEIGCVGP